MSTPARTTSNLAIVSLIFGILGWTALPMIGSIIAIVTGHMARKEIRANPEAFEGEGLAVAGLVLGYAMLAVLALVVLAVLVVFGGIAAFIAAFASH